VLAVSDSGMFARAGEFLNRRRFISFLGNIFRSRLPPVKLCDSVSGCIYTVASPLLVNTSKEESVDLIATEEAGSLSVFKTEVDSFLINKGIKGEGRRMGIRIVSAMIEWRNTLDGLNGLILLLCLMLLCSYSL